MSLRTLEKAVNRTADRTVGDIVATYGSDVQRLKMDAAAGKIDPTTALMAMMTIQRIVAANTQPPSGTTVAQDIGMAPPPQAGLSAMAPQGAPGANPVRMAYGGQVAISNNQVPSPAMERGISGLPVPDNMFDYADGGMIAFAGGGGVQRFDRGGLSAERIAARQVSPFPSSSAADLFSRQQSLIPPYMFDDEVNYRRMLERMTVDDLKELARKTPMTVPGTGETNPRFKAIEEVVRSRTASIGPYAAPQMRSAPVPNPMGGGFTPPPMQGAAAPPIPGTITPDPMKEAYEKFVGGSKRIGLSALKNLGTGAILGIPGAAVEYLTGTNPSDPAAVGRRMMPAGAPSLFALTDEAAKRVISNLLPTKEGKEGEKGKDEKGRLSAAEFYKNLSPEVQKSLDQALDAAVEAAKRNKFTEAPATTTTAPTAPTVPRQEERRGPALSPTVPALPYIGSGQTGDFAVSPEERARNLVKMSGLPKIEALSDEQALQRIKDIEAKSGVDPDFFKNIQGRIDTMREEAKTDKKEAANLRIVEAGLGILGGTSPYAFVNIGKGASEAVKGFGQDLKEYQKARRELDKAEMDLRSAEQNAARNKSNAAINLVERRQEQVNAAKTKEADLYAASVKTFAGLEEQKLDRLSRENTTMAGLQARREEVIAQIAQSDRQMAESRAARLEAAGIAADQRFVDGLVKAENNATKSYDAQIETIQKSLSNPAVAITPDFVKEQEAKVSRLIQQREAAARLARNQYIKASTSGRPTQSNKFPGFVDLTGKQ
jgi:hypothetical protein